MKDASILIIDDSVETVQLLSGMLRGMAKISFAMSGQKGLEIARTQLPDLILLDVEMPEMNGYEVCRLLKSEEATKDIAVMFVTAHISIESEILALDAGAVDYIAKPLNPPIVRARVNTHIRLHQNTAALTELANKDSLTGLYNRRYFDRCIEQELRRHSRHGLSLGLVFIDIDHFKAYNDAYGHIQGDQCLVEVAEVIQLSASRSGDCAARYGGEEFVVLLPHMSSEELIIYGERLCVMVQDLQIVHSGSMTAPYVTISVGMIARVPAVNDSAQEWTRSADAALYRAKSSGRNRSVQAKKEFC